MWQNYGQQRQVRLHGRDHLTMHSQATETDWKGVWRTLGIIGAIALAIAAWPLWFFLVSILWLPALVAGIVWAAVKYNRKPVGLPKRNDGTVLKPFLFLDVDGVVNCLGGTDVEHVDLDGTPLSKPVGLDRRLDRLQRYYRIVWATTWGDDALAIYPYKRWSVLRWNGDHGKLPAIIEFAGHSGWVWVDDNALEEAQTQMGEHLLDNATSAWQIFQADPRRGLDEALAEELVSWARERR